MLRYMNVYKRTLPVSLFNRLIRSKYHLNYSDMDFGRTLSFLFNFPPKFRIRKWINLLNRKEGR